MRERLGQGKVGTANVSEPSSETALGMAPERWLITGVAERSVPWRTAPLPSGEGPRLLSGPAADTPGSRGKEGAYPSRISDLRNVVSPTGSGAKAPVSRPRGRPNPPAGKGCRRKRRPAAERQRESITGRISP